MKLRDGFPSSETQCPLINNSNDILADCLDFSNNKITADPGKYLRRYMALCQFTGKSALPWWRTFHRIEFPTQAACEAIRSSTDGLTTANIVDNGLVGQTIKINFGLGANGDEQNIVFSPKGHVQYLWTDFPTGSMESKQGGIEVTFNASNERRINIQGIQVKNYGPNNGLVNSPIDMYVDISSQGATNVLNLISDKTISSIEAGDRKFERVDAALDFQWGSSYPLEVKFSGTTPVILQGGKVRVQHNSSGALSLSTITQDLRFSDPTCCWPTSGQITTDFNSLYDLPTVRRKTFDKEVVDFTSTCGQVTLTQSGANAADEVGGRTVMLDQCF